MLCLYTSHQALVVIMISLTVKLGLLSEALDFNNVLWNIGRVDSDGAFNT